MNPELQQLADRLDRAEARQQQAEHRQHRAERRARLSWACALCALALTALLGVRPAALAQSPGVSLASLVARLSADEKSLNSLAARVGSDEDAIGSNRDAVQALQTKTAPITTTGNATRGYQMTIAGANVQIVDGSGLTDDGTQGEVSGAKLTGLGNLIIGYNATGNSLGGGDVRTGSHNLILGDQNNYSSFGGLIAGLGGLISGPYASISGGYRNTAGNQYASVSGGVGVAQYNPGGWSGGSYRSP